MGQDAARSTGPGGGIAIPKVAFRTAKDDQQSINKPLKVSICLKQRLQNVSGLGSGPVNSGCNPIIGLTSPLARNEGCFTVYS